MGDRALNNIIESQGGGAAWLDYDRDGRMDLYLATGVWMKGLSQGPFCGHSERNRLYRNNGDGTFTDVTDRAGVGLRRYSMGVAVGDYDNDGYPDIYVCCYRGPNVLYHNNGDGTFTDVAVHAGVADNQDCVSAVFFDYDNDGLLDLYVGNYLHYDPAHREHLPAGEYPGPQSYGGEPSVLYHNNGDGTFTDVTRRMGVYDPSGKAMGVSAADADGDGWVDLYQANDGLAKRLYHNDHGRRFVDVAQKAGVAFGSAGEKAASMMGAWADYDGDGLLDLFVTDDATKPLFHNEGRGVFQDLSAQAGVAPICGKATSWGACFVDAANKGTLDLFIANGGFFRLEGERSKLLANDGRGRFHDVSQSSGPYFHRSLCGRAAAMADYDNDGGVDLVVTNLDGPPILLHNDTADRGHWIGVWLEGVRSNRDGVGAQVRVTCGNRTWVAQRTGAGAYLSENDPRIHFGIGEARRVDRLEVRWPSGIRQVMERVPADRVIRVREPSR
ncbi:MAG: CRTAC1 family protein [Chthonomonadales bacterium]